MSVPYGEIMKYRGSPELPHIYDVPVYVDIKSVIRSFVGAEDNVLDFGCGKGWVYHDVLLPSGFKGKYVGIDNDPMALALASFPIYANIQDLAKDFKAGDFDTLLMMNSIEHFQTVNEMFTVMVELNKYIDGTILIQTPNSLCFDYMFVDPQHKTFFSYEALYGLVKLLDYDKVQMYRGEGIHQIRKDRYKKEPQRYGHFPDMNEFQKKVCMAMGLDWYGNIVAIGKREPKNEQEK